MGESESESGAFEICSYWIKLSTNIWKKKLLAKNSFLWRRVGCRDLAPAAERTNGGRTLSNQFVAFVWTADNANKKESGIRVAFFCTTSQFPDLKWHLKLSRRLEQSRVREFAKGLEELFSFEFGRPETQRNIYWLPYFLLSKLAVPFAGLR